ncbi:hypothetical protein R3P38DRAFT_3500892 [Favolaschia claudopus]|uniref:Transposase n=1 Tax=Favolaschia claudopus TaxID=2862362 RepID=A0AAV9Z3T2_9AGAR
MPTERESASNIGPVTWDNSGSSDRDAAPKFVSFVFSTFSAPSLLLIPLCMSVFEAGTVQEQLRPHLKDVKSKFKTWDNKVKDHVDSWIKIYPSEFHGENSQIRLQLTFEANVVEYVSLMYTESRHHGNSKASGPKTLPKGFPVLGPRFMPPSLLEAKKRSPANIQPTPLYMRPLNVVHPFYYNNFSCPQCDSTDIKWDSWTGGGARGVVHGVRREERAIGYQLRCNECKRKYGQGGSEAGAKGPDNEKLGYSFATTNPKFWARRQHWEIPRGVPIFFHRCALTRELFDLIVELRPSTTSGKLAENIKQLHLLEYKQRELEYLEAFRTRFIPTLNFGATAIPLQEFSAPHDTSGYNDESITDDLITDTFIEFTDRTRAAECSKYLRTLTAICINLDNTFKVAKKATVVNSSNERSKLMKGGVLSVLNELNQIICWRFCQSESTREIVELLEGLKRRFALLGVDDPEMVTVDNCCHVRSGILQVFPLIKVLLDVHHLLMRYGAVILNGTRNPRRAEVMKDLRNSIIKESANKDSPARYWTQSEQEARLSDAFTKWVTRGGVWSAAAHNVHNAQLSHVHRGCLARPRDDIASDGSRIEGSHKGWNSLQRSVASGLKLQTSLGHDFVLRRNIRVALDGKTKYDDPFVKSTFGSHHIGLVDHNASLWNALLTPGGVLSQRPRLVDVPSEEKFGIVPSAHADTFDGLFLIKPEPEDEDVDSMGLEDVYSEQPGEMYTHHRAILIEELNLDPKLFDQPLDVGLSLPQPKQIRESEAENLEAVTPISSVSIAQPRNSDIAMMDIGLSVSAGPIRSTGQKRKQSDQDDLAVQIPTIDTASDTKPQTKKPRIDKPVYPIFAAHPGPAASQMPLSSTPNISSGSNSTSYCVPTTIATPSVQLSVEELNKPLPLPDGTASKLTPSQLLFQTGTGINPRTLQIAYGAEFYAFMDLRLQRQWKTFEMTPKRWAADTELYNDKLRLLTGGSTSYKHPRALVDKLAEIEPKIIHRIQDDNYKLKSGKTAYWKKHCDAVSLVKVEPGEKAASTSARKPQTCTRCKTLKYPGPSGSPENHKKLFCSDGFRPTLTGETVAPWPLPPGVFSAGIRFHPRVLLAHVREVYTRLFVDKIKREDLSLEDDAFLRLLDSRVVIVPASDDDKLRGAVLFKMFATFSIPASDTFPDDLIIDYNGSKHLFINSLRGSPLPAQN